MHLDTHLSCGLFSRIRAWSVHLLARHRLNLRSLPTCNRNSLLVRFWPTGCTPPPPSDLLGIRPVLSPCALLDFNDNPPCVPNNPLGTVHGVPSCVRGEYWIVRPWHIVACWLRTSCPAAVTPATLARHIWGSCRCAVDHPTLAR